MGRYRLWLDPYIDVKRYQMEYLTRPKTERQSPKVKANYKMCKVLSFMIDDQIKNSFSLEEIDFITARYLDEDDFLIPIIEEIFTKDPKNKIEIGNPLVTYKSNGNLHKLDIVYDSPLLLQYAIKEQKRKRHHKERDRLEDSKELQSFCNKLLNIMKSEEDKRYFLTPNDSPLSYLEQEKIKTLLPKKLKMNNQFFVPVSLYETLKNYSLSYDARCEKQKKDHATLQDDISVDNAQQAVYNALRKDYKTLRNAVLSMKIYENGKELEEKNRVSCIKDHYEQEVLSFSSPYESMEYQEYLKTQEENDDILRKIAKDAKIRQEEIWNRGGEDKMMDEYSFEEKDWNSPTILEKGTSKHG